MMREKSWAIRDYIQYTLHIQSEGASKEAGLVLDLCLIVLEINIRVKFSLGLEYTPRFINSIRAST